MVQNSASRIIIVIWGGLISPQFHSSSIGSQFNSEFNLKNFWIHSMPFTTFLVVVCYNLAPSYLSDHLIASSSGFLCSSSSIHLSVLSAHINTMGNRGFSRSAPKLWNSVPPDGHNIDSLPVFTCIRCVFLQLLTSVKAKLVKFTFDCPAIEEISFDTKIKQ